MFKNYRRLIITMLLTLILTFCNIGNQPLILDDVDKTYAALMNKTTYELTDINAERVREICLPIEEQYATVSISDGYYIFSGGYLSESLSLTKTDKDWNRIFKKTYDGIFFTYSTYYVTPDSGIVIIAPTKIMETDSEKPECVPAEYVMIRLDGDGNTLWELPLTTNVEQVDKLIILPNQEIYTVGTFQMQDVTDQSTVQGQVQKYIMPIDSISLSYSIMKIKDGEIINKYICDDFPKNRFDVALDIADLDNGIAVSFGRGTNYIEMYDFDLNLMWTAEHSGSSQIGSNRSRLASVQNEVFYLGRNLDIFSSEGKLIKTVTLNSGNDIYSNSDMASNGSVFYTENDKLFMLTETGKTCIDDFSCEYQHKAFNNFFATEDNGLFVGIVYRANDGPANTEFLAYTKYDANGNLEFRKIEDTYVWILEDGTIIRRINGKE